MIIEAAVAHAWDDLWEAELHAQYNPACCILATRVAVETLKFLGVRAWPIATHTTIFNRPAMELVRADVPHEAWPEHAWSVGAGPESPGNGYAGHLWCGTDAALIDLSARQWHRPGRITVTGSFVAPPLDGGGERWLGRDDGTTLYVRRVGDRGYRTAPDWVRNWRPLVPRLLERLLA